MSDEAIQALTKDVEQLKSEARKPMSDSAIAALTKQVETLTADNAKLRGEAKQRRQKATGLQEQLDALNKAHELLKAKSTELETAAKAGPKELTEKVTALQAQLHARDHKDAFNEKLKDFKVKSKDPKTGKDVETQYMLRDKATVETLWREMQYKAEGEVPDSTKLEALLGKAVEHHTFLFSSAADAATQPITVPPSQRGPGGGKGDTPPPTGKTAADIVNQRWAKTGTGRDDRL